MTGPTIPFYRHNFSISEALARGGVKGGAIPPMEAGVQPVMVLADLSASYSGEPLEGRGICAHDSFSSLPATPPLERSFARLESIAPGGIVLEFVYSSVSGTPTGAVMLDLIPSESLFAREEQELPILSVGGEPIRTRFFDGRTTAMPSGSGPWVFNQASFIGQGTPIRCYVPSGSNFVVYAAETSGGGFQSIYIAMVFREIPQGIGLP